jgi:large conductance mechanosensitive channel
MIKINNATKKKEAAAPSVPPAPTKEEILLTEIRDLLAKKA